MAKLREFLDANPDLRAFQQEQQAPKSGEDPAVTLFGILLAAVEDQLTFAHLGHRFTLAGSDVLSVEETDIAIPNPFRTGKPVALRLRTGARLTPYGAVAAESLSAGLPFAIARPSQVGEIDYPFHTANELAWLAANNIPAEGPAPTSTNSGTYCGHNTQSPKWSGTNSNGKQDDGKSDEYYGDDATHDDSKADD